jgi:predicted RNase H-like HicB family nuclease
VSEYLVILEKAKNNYSAFSPDLPGCIATGATQAETMKRMEQAIRLHIKGLQEDGLRIPKPTSTAKYIAV